MAARAKADEHLQEPITRFWKWFTENEERLKRFYSAKQFERLTAEINHELDQVERQLAWEIGPGKTKPYLLTISGEGDLRLWQTAELMIDRAPDLPDWEFYSSRPPRPAADVVQLPESDARFETADWQFVAIERPEVGRVDLVVIDDQLAAAESDSALKVVSIYLDQVLGEDMVESWIGRFSVESRLAARGKKSHPISELPDYLLWVTHRENEPLRKPTDRLQ